MTSSTNNGFTFVPPKPPQVMAADANEEEEESITINDEEGEEEEALYLHNFRDMTAYRLTHEALEKERERRHLLESHRQPPARRLVLCEAR